MRVRVRYSKLGKIRFTSHRDVARLWERALRRSGLPIASTEGFNPRPKVHFGLALSTSHESLGEYLDIDFLEQSDGEAIDIAVLPDLLTPMFPAGIDIIAAAVIERSETSLQEAVTSCRWRIEVPDLPSMDRESGVSLLLAAEALPVSRERKGKTMVDDLRPAIRDLVVSEDGMLEAELSTQPRGVRPSELLTALSNVMERDEGFEEGRVRRTHQWIELDGARREPLLPPATRAPHAEARAS